MTPMRSIGTKISAALILAGVAAFPRAVKAYSWVEVGYGEIVDESWALEGCFDESQYAACDDGCDEWYHRSGQPVDCNEGWLRCSCS